MKKNYFLESVCLGLAAAGIVSSAAAGSMPDRVLAAEQTEEKTVSDDGTMEGGESGNAVSWNNLSGNDVSENAVSWNNLSGNGVSGNAVSPNVIFESGVSGNAVSWNDLSGNGVSENAVSSNGLSENDVPGNNVSGNTVSDSDLSNNPIWQKMDEKYHFLDDSREPELTLKERQRVKTSYQETREIMERDNATISGNEIDFSQMTVACLGDSITEAANLDREENYRQYSYPTVMKETLGLKEVYNLGIGGSSIGRYWSEAFVDRYQEIPPGTDVILVMGGTNDGFAASLVEFGNEKERKERTFWGDLDALMDGLKQDYPEADIIFLTPLPNSLQDYLRSERNYLLPQENFVYVIKQLAREHGLEVWDLYHSNLLDGHDKDVVLQWMPDGVHPNEQGYEILGRHISAELIRHMARGEKAAVSGNDVSGNELMSSDVSGNDVSGNDVSGSAVSGNGISGNDVSGSTVSGNDISGNDISGNDISGNHIGE